MFENVCHFVRTWSYERLEKCIVEVRDVCLILWGRCVWGTRRERYTSKCTCSFTIAFVPGNKQTASDVPVLLSCMQGTGCAKISMDRLANRRCTEQWFFVHIYLDTTSMRLPTYVWCCSVWRIYRYQTNQSRGCVGQMPLLDIPKPRPTACIHFPQINEKHRLYSTKGGSKKKLPVWKRKITVLTTHIHY